MSSPEGAPSENPRLVALELQYDGTDFCGWQSQAQGERTVQDALTDAIERITGQRVMVSGAGRTDSGVHALGQVASFSTNSKLSPEVLVRALNAVLPYDLRVIKLIDAPDGFHPRFSATGKRYGYYIANAPVMPPFARPYAWHFPKALDALAMREAASSFVGRHDFKAFQAAGSDVTDTVRTIWRCQVLTDLPPVAPGMEGMQIKVVVEGGGFLRHMVRTMVGTLVEVGSGALAAGDVAGIIASVQRSNAGPTAPARGLFLEEVYYGGQQ